VKNEKRKRIFFLSALIALVLFTNPFIIRKLVTWYETKPVTLAANEHYSAGIVLGGFVSYHLQDDRGYFNSSSDRFIQTALLYKTGKIGKIIIPAGNGYIVQHGFREADFIREHFIELGIPASDIYTDADSRNTLENAVNTKKILDSVRLAPPYLLISSAVHLPRAQRVFTKLGMDVRLYPCDFQSKGVGNNFFEDDLLPSSTALRLWDNLIKELAGAFIYKLTGKGN
jgi:uncharacterized SAM-binding protein YcdF (DUF218 family)